MLPHRKEELRDLVWAKTGKDPVSIRTQGLLVVAEFIDGAVGVWRIEELEEVGR